jgi:hypothetical protein
VAKIAKSADRIGKFSKARGSAPPPVRAEIDRPGDVRESVSKAAAQAVGESAIRPQRPETRRAKSIVPARSAGELHDQIGRITEAFREREGRDPMVDDKEFWAAYAELVGRFADARLGPPREGAASPVRKAVADRLAVEVPPLLASLEAISKRLDALEER